MFLISFIWAGFVAGFIAFYFFVKLEGLILGSIIWLLSGFFYMLIDMCIGKLWPDDAVVIIASVALAVGVAFFQLR